MFVRSRLAKKAHTDVCPYARRIKQDNKLEYFLTDEVIEDGCVFCQHCTPMKKVLKKYDKKIKSLASVLRLKYYLEGGMLIVEDGMSKWKVYYSRNENVYVVHHKNYLDCNKATSIFEGYHLQKDIRPTNVYAVFEYVTEHFHAYMENKRLPKKIREKAKVVFYDERNYQRPKTKSEKDKEKKRKLKKRNKPSKRSKIRRVMELFDLIQKEKHVG